MQKTCTLLVALVTYAFAYGQKFEQEHGLFYEIPDSLNAGNINFFNADNNIYQPGREFIYSYRIIKNGDTLQVRVNEPNDTQTQNWTFVKNSAGDSLTIGFLGIDVQSGYGGLDDLFPGYSQTVIRQRYYSFSRQLLFEGSTGLVENEKNIWIHPFRGKYFSVLEFSPFPYIKLPLSVGARWTWKLNDISDRWSDARIVTYERKQNASYYYQLTEKKKIQSAFGRITCYVTESTASTSLGQTGLISYFHPKHGFVRLDYKNIDGSILQLQLINVLSGGKKVSVNPVR